MHPSKSKEKTLSAHQIRELLDYCPNSGIFTWRVQAGSQKPGAKAGTLHHSGYWQLRIKSQSFLAHRLAWLYENGEFPNFQIDHKNGNRTDNRISNLREASHVENHQNRACVKGSSSRFVGVYWNKKNKKWRADIMKDGVQHYLGYFDSEESAYSAYKSAKSMIHEFNPHVRAEVKRPAESIIHGSVSPLG